MINNKYLGLIYAISGNLTAATDKHLLEKNKISRILTIDSCPLPQKITDIRGINTFFVQGKWSFLLLAYAF